MSVVLSHIIPMLTQMLSLDDERAGRRVSGTCPKKSISSLFKPPFKPSAKELAQQRKSFRRQL